MLRFAAFPQFVNGLDCLAGTKVSFNEKVFKFFKKVLGFSLAAA
jgi:hypothetical protein